MFNFQAVGFAVVLGVVALGVDYHQQTQKAGAVMGDLTAGAYFDTITDRFGAMQQAKADKVATKERKSRQRAGARVYLPEAPEGWTRRAWLDGDNSRISQLPREMEDFEKKAIESNAFLKQMKEKGEKRKEQALNDETWVYERGDEIVSVRARFVQKIEGNTISANAMNMVKSNISLVTGMDGWGVIQGVAFGTYRSFVSDKPKDYSVILATIGFGDEVKLEVRSTASEETTREILNRIDYDGLNALLPDPLGFVGSNAPDVAMELQKPLADKMIALRNQVISRQSAAIENWMRQSNGPGDAMTLALRQVGFNIEGSMGDADAALAQVLQQIEAEATADPRDQASAEDAIDSRPVETASAATVKGTVSQNSPAEPLLVSKRLPEDKIKELQSLNDETRVMAEIGLKYAVRKFETEKGLPEGSCEFSMENYRVECMAKPEDHAKADGAGGFLSKFGIGGGDATEPEPQVKPKRLQLSGGTSCLENSLGSLCKN